MKKDNGKLSIISLNNLIDKVTSVKKKNKFDLSSDQDLSIAVMNLISIEEHFFFSGGKTGSTKYYDLINEVREIRKELLKKLIGEVNDGSERWCISKHLLAASMRLMEVGTKQLDLLNKKEAYDFFDKSYDLYALFWGLNLDLLDVNQVKALDNDETDAAKNMNNNDGNNQEQAKKTGIRAMLGKVVQKVVDCCLE